jgi:peptidoglycan/LPS O-acetylase OafA/YrhL/glycopeptide antibiotics resistance protein
MKSIFFFISILIVYGSLYPFNFTQSALTAQGISALFNFEITKTQLTNLIANIVLFVPFGVFLRAAFPKYNSAGQLLLLAFMTFLFAYSIQALQIFTEDRQPWGGDAILNMIGYAIGVFLYGSLRLDFLKTFKASHSHQQISFFIAFIIIALELAPFAPSVDFDVLKANIKLLLNSPSIGWYWTFENTVFWLVTFYLLKIAFPNWTHINKLSLLVMLILTSKFLIISSNINLSSLAGGILSLLIWKVFSQRINAQQLAILLLITILGNGLYPFELREQVGTFKWLPFSASMDGNLLINIIAFTKKTVFYGGVVWLFYLAKRRLLFGAVICAAIALLSEFLQIFFTNSVPDSTDFFIVIMVAFIIHQRLKLKSGVNEPLPLQSQSSDKGNNVILISPKNTQNMTNTPYIYGLDGLRAIAALAVFFVHFQQFTGVGGVFLFVDLERWMINGNTGVALFFVLSGFLLSMPFWHSFKSNQFPNIKHYFINRAARIIPLYYLCLFGLLAIKSVQGSDVNFNNIISHLFFLHNLKDYQVMSLNPPFWTLAVEFQFYLLLPLFFVLLFKLGLRKAQVLCFLLIPVIYLCYRYFMGQMAIHNEWPISIPLIWPFGVSVESAAGQSLTYSLFAHLPHFLIGLFAASFYRQNTSRWAEAVFWVSVGLVFALLATALDESLQLDFGRYNFPFVPVLLGLIVYTAPQAKWARYFLELSALKWLGVISYGVYIFHYPIQKATLRAFEAINIDASQQVLLYLFITLAATLLVSHFAYKLIERPIMSWFKRASLVKGQSKVANEQLKNAGAQLPSKLRKPTKKRLSLALITLAVLTASIAFVLNMSAPKVKVEQVYWAGSKANRMIFDHHAHTTYSDGEKSVAELTELAYIKGCDAFSITDHSQNQRSFSSVKLREIAAMRKKYPVMLIFAGIELGMPSYDGREHVNIITTPEFESQTLGAVMSALQTSTAMPAKERDLHVLRAINKVSNARDNTIAIYNHPSRKDENKGQDENYADITFWNQDVDYITAIAGAPGHQNKAQIGSYEAQILPMDRWDPIVAKVGGTWDKLLAKGHKIWGAIASSDYHNDKMDYGPCEFSRIHVDAPTKDYSGLISGIKAGSFWADHGKLLRDYQFTVESKDDGYRVYPGGTINLMGNKRILSVDITAKRSENYKNDFLRLDLITNCSNDEVLFRSTLLPPEESSVSLLLPIVEQQGACFVRSRIVRESLEENKLSAYSNPIFVVF